MLRSLIHINERHKRTTQWLPSIKIANFSQMALFIAGKTSEINFYDYVYVCTDFEIFAGINLQVHLV